MFFLLNIILSCLFGGLLLSVLLLIICYLLPKGVHLRPSYSSSSFIVLFFAFFFFLFQSSLLIGGFKAKRYTEEAKIIVEAISDEIQNEINPVQIDKTINWFIARRFGWLIGGLIVTGGLMCKLTTESQQRNTINNEW